MMIENVERYLQLRRTLGYKLFKAGHELRAFANLAKSRGEDHVTDLTAQAWADQAPSAYSRSNRMRKIVLFAKFLNAEDIKHEVPSFEKYRYRYERPLPYIYTAEEISQMMAATAKLKKQKPIRREMYKTLIGLISTTGLRLSEALNLKFSDIEPEGVLRICDTKFGKSRLIPLHPTTQEAFSQYIDLRRKCVFEHDFIFFSRGGNSLPGRTFSCTFHTILKIAGVAKGQSKRPRIHDLRHTFATRALQNCPTDRKQVAKHFVALSTYLGHFDVNATYWYLEATPDLMIDVANAVETFFGGDK